MAIQVGLTHVTHYRYDRPVRLGPQIVRLRPAPHSRTRILSYSQTITPADHFLNWQQDPHANYLARLVFPEPVREFKVEIDLVAELASLNPFDFFLEPDAEKVPFAYDDDLSRQLAPYLAVEAAGPGLQAWLAEVDRTTMATIDFLVALNQRLEADIHYNVRMEPGVQSCEETLAKASGSCRDSAWLLVQILRHLGIAARFVSGYLIQLVADERPLDGPQGPLQDFTDLHAWCEAYLPGAGWVGLDPTSGLFAGEGHIPLAAAPDPTSAAPITGVADAANVDFQFDMAVRRIAGPARVTLPYDEAQWAAIDRLGQAVDARLAEGDVRLTMGGEPTFVAVDGKDEGEWNTEAVGPTKRGYAEALIRRLRDRFAPDGLLHYGQGKWYPGEPLPRWAFALYWRDDGEALWHDPALIARESEDCSASIEDAGRFARALAARLGVDRACAVEAYEDPLPYVGQEQRLPENLTVTDNKLDSEEDRARVARVFERGLGKPSGYVLPIQRWQADGAMAGRHGGWMSEVWSFRRKRLYLAPGDSPIGLRLPLGALPWVAPASYPYYFPDDPFGPRPPLPSRSRPDQMTTGESSRLPAERQGVVEQHLTPDGSAAVRTAMAFEPRDGRLCVFMPPTQSAADYVELVAAVEETAAELALPIHLEGYTPPPDARLNVIKVTPDPGVVEVNVQPAADWSDLKAITQGLYEEARLTRLTAEKFMIDGRHTGTGGGNHMVLGGASPADSPFLRRPDLLVSLVRCWQRHPSLSYLFSGLFIGPTSQAPRVDEARHDTLYELEIAFAEIDRLQATSGSCPPWMIDRALRDLLIDSSGNTHRTEICIDKLYAPDGPTGRLGLVEFRGFEMPPHPRMSLVQQLLLRALVARFWDDPYRGSLVRWGTRLHDEFMLPHYVWQDILGVLDELKAAGFAFDPAWFAPHFEFRFPHLGSVQHGGVTLEVRQALEPWHVLGEDGAVGGTARYVDSSLERVQVRLADYAAERFSVTCNGHALPLAPTATAGEAVAGVRFRAWQPARALQPTIGIHAPLVFDIIDRSARRSIGGCTYHVAHPGGRSYDTLPVNSYEAESRRLSRFFAIGHTPGSVTPPAPHSNPDFPHTLDLRRASA